MNSLSIKDFVVVTTNKNKLKEINSILKTNHKISKIEVPEIQSLDIDKVIRAKATSAYEQLRKPVLVEDISLEIQTLNGLPGPFVKFFLESIGTEGTVNLLGNKSTKTKVVATLALYDGTKIKIFKGTVWGTLSKKNRGESGFGFDKVFIPNGYNKTYAEMDQTLKNQISHRAKALKKLEKYLGN